MEADMSEAKPLIGITMGDPAGIGPEIALRSLADDAILAAATPLIIGDVSVLRSAADATDVKVAFDTISLDKWRAGLRPQTPSVVDLANINAEAVQPGAVSPECGRAAYEYILFATEAATSGRIDALATGPIHKQALRAAGVDFPGHTELLAKLTNTDIFCMMMWSPRLVVTLVTCHLAMADVPGRLSVEPIRRVIGLTARAMEQLTGPEPMIVVCGLNPHAGEGGFFGDEEEQIIKPAIEAARKDGARVSGPVPPDTAFIPSLRACTDAYVCMYHDQGLIPFKMSSFADGVNITLGLPIVRTSVDHGTALDIAWQGKADHSSMRSAVALAARLVEADARV
jgi:4-hydroxythreonine-4-phosphate dehydrogenase